MSNDEVVKITITDKIDNVLYLDIRVRGETKWFYFNNLTIEAEVGNGILIVDDFPEQSPDLSYEIDRNES